MVCLVCGASFAPRKPCHHAVKSQGVKARPAPSSATSLRHADGMPHNVAPAGGAVCRQLAAAKIPVGNPRAFRTQALLGTVLGPVNTRCTARGQQTNPDSTARTAVQRLAVGIVRHGRASGEQQRERQAEGFDPFHAFIMVRLPTSNHGALCRGARSAPGKRWAIPPHRGMALCKRGLACECKLTARPCTNSVRHRMLAAHRRVAASGSEKSFRVHLGITKLLPS